MIDSPELTTLVTDFVSRNVGKILEIGHSIFGGAKAELKLRLNKAYTNYLKNSGERYGWSKSFFVRSIPTYLYDFYVPLGVTSGGKMLDKATLDSILDLTTRAVVTAPAGAGKSMFLRHLFLDGVQSSNRVPIFVELRNLNSTNNSIVHGISDSLRTFGFDLGDKYIEKAIGLGHFIILLDGFDEVPPEFRRRISRQIVNFSQQARDCVIIVSSRPDDTFSGWEDFRELAIAPLNISEACELVEKLPFDSDLKRKFLADLRNFLFDRHKSFLSNPLLLSIMLLTYGESADIPKKLSLFYNQAYEALFQRHDALKGGYQRERRTSLDIQDFARIFSAFCLQTYDNRRFQFSRSDALEYIRKAKEHVSIEVQEEDFLTDCLQSVCLLVEDGLNIVFSHRSFQEYFVARYIHNEDPRIQKKLLERFVGLIQRDSVYKLLYEINPGLVERDLLVPKLKMVFEDLEVKRSIGITHFFRFLTQNFSEIIIHPDRLGFVHRSNRLRKHLAVDIIIFAYRRCVVQDNIELSERQRDIIFEKYGAETEVTYDLSTLSIKSPIIKDIAETRGVFSIDALEQVLRAFRKLEHKHANVPKSLDALLK